MSAPGKKIVGKIRKYYRWLALNWFYVMRVLRTEQEMGGGLDAC